MKILKSIIDKIKNFIEWIKELCIDFWKAMAPIVVSLCVLFAYAYYKDMQNVEWKEARQGYFTAFNQWIDSYQSYKDILQRAEEAQNKYTFRNENILNVLNKANKATEIYDQTQQEAKEAFDFRNQQFQSNVLETIEADTQTYQYYAELLNQHTQAQEMLINALQEYVEILTLESLKSH